MLPNIENRQKSSTDRGASRNRILGLDGLRAFAVSLVVLSHVGLLQNGLIREWGVSNILNAQVGVQIFFVLSGFLITSLLLAEYEKNGRIQLLNFYARRAIRIFPVYYAAIFFSFILSITGVYGIKKLAYFFAATYTINFASWAHMDPTFSHFWSLAVEEHFYLVWPLILVLAQGKLRIALLFSVIAIGFIFAWQSSPPSFVMSLSGSHPVSRWTIPAALPIIVGSFTAILVWKKNIPFSVLIITSLMGLAVSVLRSYINPILVPLLTSFAIAAIILFVSRRQDGLIVKILEWRPLTYIGTISYGIYVWQGVFTGNGPYRRIADWPPSPIIGACIALFVAAISYHFFEKPILRLKKSFSS